MQEPQLVHGAQDDFWELVLFFLSVGSGLRILIVRLGSKHLAPLSQFTGPQKFANLSQACAQVMHNLEIAGSLSLAFVPAQHQSHQRSFIL